MPPVSATSEVVVPSALLRGFEQAFDRFMVTGRMSADPEEAFFPIFEALNWATSLDDRLREELSTIGQRDDAAARSRQGRRR